MAKKKSSKKKAAKVSKVKPQDFAAQPDTKTEGRKPASKVKAFVDRVKARKAAAREAQ